MRIGVLLKKELTEYWRTYRAVVLAAVFVLFGLLSPLTARYLPEILKSLNLGGGVIIQLPPPTIADANTQFVKNMTQIGVIVMILVAMGAVSRERDRGTASFTLSKPAPRGAFLAAKATALGILTWGSLLLAMVADYYYTLLLLGPIPFTDCLAMAALVGLYLTSFLAVTFLGSTVTKSLAVAAAIGFGGYLLISLLGSIPGVADYLPGALLGWSLTAGNGASQAVWSGAFVSIGIIVACLVLSWLFFRRAEL